MNINLPLFNTALADRQAVAAYQKAILGMQTCPDPLYDAWSRKAETFSHADIHGSDMKDTGRAKFLAVTLMSIPSVPKSLKAVLKRVESWKLNDVTVTKPESTNDDVVQSENQVSNKISSQIPHNNSGLRQTMN